MGDSSLAEFGITDFKISKGPELRNLGTQLTQIESLPVNQLSHFERHWQGNEPGSVFLPNKYFAGAAECVRCLETVAKSIIPQEELDRSHIITLEFDTDIGNIGIEEIQPDDPVVTYTRDQGQFGETEIKVMFSPERKKTNLLTVEFKPKFPLKGSKEPVKFQISSSFPGEPAPRMITKRRAERYKEHPEKDPDFENDRQFWEKHALVAETDLPGVWMKQHQIPLPDISRFLNPGDILSSGKSDYIVVLDENQRVIVISDIGLYTGMREEDYVFDHDKFFKDAKRRVQQALGQDNQNLSTQMILLSPEEYRSIPNLDVVNILADDLVGEVVVLSDKYKKHKDLNY